MHGDEKNVPIAGFRDNNDNDLNDTTTTTTFGFVLVQQSWLTVWKKNKTDAHTEKKNTHAVPAMVRLRGDIAATAISGFTTSSPSASMPT